MTDKKWAVPQQQGFNFKQAAQDASNDKIAEMQAALLRTETLVRENAPKNLNENERATHDTLMSAVGSVASYDTKMLNQRNPSRDETLLTSLEMLKPKAAATTPDESGKKPDRFRATYDAYAANEPAIAAGLEEMKQLVEKKAAQTAAKAAAAHR